MKAETRCKRYMKVEAENTATWLECSHKMIYDAGKRTTLNLALTSYRAMERQANQLVIEILEEE